MNDQLIFKFPSDNLYLKEDYYVSSSNQEAYDFINSWPNWIKKISNIFFCYHFHQEFREV